ncbi:MAG: flavodoxin domain-containing protein, partial [Phycisphaerae bacterium]
MSKGIVVYYSKSGNTKQMAELITGAMNSEGLPTECRSVDKVSAGDLLEYDAIVQGSPNYYGQ